MPRQAESKTYCPEEKLTRKHHEGHHNVRETTSPRHANGLSDRLKTVILSKGPPMPINSGRRMILENLNRMVSKQDNVILLQKALEQELRNNFIRLFSLIVIPWLFRDDSPSSGPDGTMSSKSQRDAHGKNESADSESRGKEGRQ